MAIVNAEMAQRVAARVLRARNIRNVLEPLLDSLRPYIKNWRTFLDQVTMFVQEWDVLQDGIDPHSVVFKTKGWGEGYSQGKQIGGFRGTKYDYDYGTGPPEYEEFGYEYPNHWDTTVIYRLDFRDLARRFSQLSAVKDRNGFHKRFLELLDNKNARLMILKLMRDGIKKFDFGDVLDNSDYAVGEFQAAFEGDADQGVDAPTPAELKAKLLKAEMKDKGRFGEFVFKVDLKLGKDPGYDHDADAGPDDFEPDYDYDHPNYGRRRW